MSDTTGGDAQVSTCAAAMPDPSSDARFHVLRLLEANPNFSQHELAADLGISVGKRNCVIRALVEKGLVNLENFQHSRHKLRYAYMLTPAGPAEKVAITAGFLRWKRAVYERLRREIDT